MLMGVESGDFGGWSMELKSQIGPKLRVDVMEHYHNAKSIIQIILDTFSFTVDHPTNEYRKKTINLSVFEWVDVFFFVSVCFFLTFQWLLTCFHFRRKLSFMGINGPRKRLVA